MFRWIDQVAAITRVNLATLMDRKGSSAAAVLGFDINLISGQAGHA